MDNNLIFANQGVLSLVDLLTIGHSHKKDDNSTIGQFNTGLITALAIAVRNDITVNIYSGGYKYTPSKGIAKDEVSGKEKEVIFLTQTDLTSFEETVHETSFGIYLGLNWSIWMAVAREFYANSIDEGGGRVSELNFDKYDTHVEVINNHPEVQDVMVNWGNYFLADQKAVLEYHSVDIYNNELPGQPYVIYKNGIQVYRDDTKKSWFLYNCKNVDIDEMRILLNRTSAEVDNSYAVRQLKDKANIGDFLDNLTEAYQEWDNLSYGTFSQEWVETVNHYYKEGLLRDFPFTQDFKKDNRFEIGVISIQSDPNNYWSTRVDVVEVVQSEEVALSFEEKIIKISSELNFTFEYPIKQSTLSSDFRVLADLKELCLYVDSYFVEEDMWQLVREVFRLQSSDPYKEYVNLLKQSTYQIEDMEVEIDNLGTEILIMQNGDI
jgi:hypothetical protein